MAYRRYGRRARRRNYRRRPRYGYFGKAGSDAQKALSMAGKALSLINAERKYVDANSEVTAQTTSPTYVLLNGTNQGDDNIGERVGRSIKMTSVYARAQLTFNAAATNTFFRCMIVKDRQSNGSTPTITEILQSSAINSPRNIDEGKRFTVLKDVVYTLSDQQPIKFFKWFTKLSDHVEYSGTTAATSDINTNAMWMIIFSTEATNGPKWDYHVRTRYLDN